MGRFTGVIFDFAGVLTSNMVEVIEQFEAREGLPGGLYLRAWATAEGQDLYRRLELGEITQEEWNEQFGALLNIPGENLMGRVLHDLWPAYGLLKVNREARAAGIRTAVLSNSLGRSPHDPYAPYYLAGNFDAVVLSDQHGIRKPDLAIFQLTLDRLGVSPETCVFLDDTEDNLLPAYRMGMTVIHALDERIVVPELRGLLELPGA